MTLYVDATAVIALGELNPIDVLRYWPAPVVITPKIREEVKYSASQIDRAIDDGWMQVASPDSHRVAKLLEDSNLHRGETELIEVATRQRNAEAVVLIDEGQAFGYLVDSGEANVVCLAQVLNELEQKGSLASTRELMNELEETGSYRWAKSVRGRYKAWCEAKGVTPV